MPKPHATLIWYSLRMYHRRYTAKSVSMVGRARERDSERERERDSERERERERESASE